MKTYNPPICPFCGRIVSKPTYLPIGFSDLEAGICECGSVYVCDVTGHNRGTAFVEALLIACAGDWDFAWDLEYDEDYKEVWIENYDFESHSILPSSEKKRGVLCFLKLADEIREVKRDKLENLFKKPNKNGNIPKVEKRKLSKNEIMDLIEKDEISLLIAYHVAEPLNLHLLQKFLYYPEIIFRKKVIVTLGKIAQVLVHIYPEKILELIKRLIYASADSAASAWGALEAVGEIIRNTEERFSLFIRNLLAFMDYQEYRPYVLYALFRIAEKNPSILKKHSYLKLLNYIENNPPEIQGLILKIFEKLNSKEILSYLNKIDPEETFEFFNYETFSLEKVFLKDLLESIKKEF
ncbi:MAG: hypothetical protein C0190_06685 [Thermodesulfobacterium geofontis]|uniref:PBS lyase n=1 Tax=Thermodesulfobacterium geofontis TaxID=1295609 RepID=A0A2N7QBV8_9BACT|nr:MAG: hypothetical protein C0190_06685 [Thermodesulfobacterium geofontis]PMP95952.1 MAG: hypothetical protein C0169_04985 [Thermodesulfobacterium geofontis]